MCADERTDHSLESELHDSVKDPEQCVTVVCPTVRVKESSGPAKGQAPLMGNAALERLTRVHRAVPLLLFGPVIGVLLWRQVVHDQIYALAVALMGGLALWTVSEYAIHRFVFHFTPRRRAGMVAAYLVHGVHHAYPRDVGRVVMPPIMSVPLACLFYLLFVGSLGVSIGEGLYAGFLAGYVGYDTMHGAFHATGTRPRWLAQLRRNHMLNHFQCPDRRFGVSTTFWAHVFRSR
jgi:sterol desaturase/sphingolipid hydroxylase (fatty acid hydroxylase superfamily)